MPGSTLRHVDPLRRRSPLYRLYARLVGMRLMGWVSRRVGWRLDPYLLSLSGGRIRLGMGIPTALLETTGARSGQRRRNAVIYFHDQADVIIVASKLGMDRHPAWLHNLRAHPEVVLGGEAFTAQVVEDEAERQRLWQLADRVLPAYATYRERAKESGRTIPIVRLMPR